MSCRNHIFEIYEGDEGQARGASPYKFGCANASLTIGGKVISYRPAHFRLTQPTPSHTTHPQPYTLLTLTLSHHSHNDT